VGDFLLLWTVRIGLGLYVAVLAGWQLVPRDRPPSWMRIAWTLGCLLSVAHVVLAFHLVHGWSHEAAVAATARQTEALLGVSYGGGVWWNYVFVGVWLADAAWWWLSPRRYLGRTRWLGWLVQGFLGFMVFNATVVFGEGLIRWAGLGACGGLVVLWLVPRPRRS
jgi:hypothetical protein